MVTKTQGGKEERGTWGGERKKTSAKETTEKLRTKD